MSDSPNEPVAPTSEPTAGKWWRRAGGALVALAILIAMGPYIVALTPLRHRAVQAVIGNAEGDVHVERARFGWLSPIAIYGLTITRPGEMPAVEIESVEGDMPLWRLAVGSREKGTFRVAEPRINMIVDQTGSNLAEIFPSDPNLADTPDPLAALEGVSATVDVQQAAVSVRAAGTTNAWVIAGINVNAGIEPIESGPQVFVRQTKLIDQARLSPEICTDLLGFIAPALAEVTRAEGAFSIDLHQDLLLPLRHPEQGQIDGRFTIHQISVGPGPLFEAIAGLLGASGGMRLADETVVDFELIDERIHHQALEFYLGPIAVRTSGSVGFDETLDLVATLALPEMGRADGGPAPIRNALSGASIDIPITGTLAEPQLGTGQLGDSVLGTVGAILDDDEARLDETLSQLQDVLEENDLTMEALAERIQERRELRAQRRAELEESGGEAAGRFPVLEGFLEDRPRLFAPREGSAPDADASQEAPARPLRNLLRRRRAPPPPAESSSDRYQ